MIELKNVKKSFGKKQVLKGINLTIETGKTTVIIGSSGSGKSVLLKLIVGLLHPDEGEVLIDGEDITKMDEKDVYRVRKKFGFLFQGAALFDSMTVAQNVGLGLAENTNMKPKEIESVVKEKLELVKLPNTMHLKPAELSGGMKKRVGLARALAGTPEILLYDEPTTGLDPVTSDAIDSLIDELAKELKVTSIVVTHDIFSVYEVADCVAMVYDGVIHWQGRPKELQATDDDVVRKFLARTDSQKARG